MRRIYGTLSRNGVTLYTMNYFLIISCCHIFLRGLATNGVLLGSNAIMESVNDSITMRNNGTIFVLNIIVI